MEPNEIIKCTSCQAPVEERLAAGKLCTECLYLVCDEGYKLTFTNDSDYRAFKLKDTVVFRGNLRECKLYIAKADGKVQGEDVPEDDVDYRTPAAPLRGRNGRGR